MSPAKLRRVSIRAPASSVSGLLNRTIASHLRPPGLQGSQRAAGGSPSALILFEGAGYGSRQAGGSDRGLMGRRGRRACGGVPLTPGPHGHCDQEPAPPPRGGGGG